MTTISITTAGFDEVRPLSDEGRIVYRFSASYQLGHICLGLLPALHSLLLPARSIKYFKTQKNMKAVTELNHHVILCGFGRNGQQAARTLKNHNMDFVVIEKEKESLEKALPFFPELIYLVGDGTDDDLLKKAGIDKAIALITALPDGCR